MKEGEIALFRNIYQSGSYWNPEDPSQTVQAPLENLVLIFSNIRLIRLKVSSNTPTILLIPSTQVPYMMVFGTEVG
jgi:hypothetical protein